MTSNSSLRLALIACSKLATFVAEAVELLIKSSHPHSNPSQSNASISNSTRLVHSFEMLHRLDLMAIRASLRTWSMHSYPPDHYLFVRSHAIQSCCTPVLPWPGILHNSFSSTLGKMFM